MHNNNKLKNNNKDYLVVNDKNVSLKFNKESKE